MMKDSCGFCAPFNLDHELEGDDMVKAKSRSPRSPKATRKNMSEPGDSDDVAAVSSLLDRNKAASPTLESIPEAEKEKSRSYEEEEPPLPPAPEREDEDDRRENELSPSVAREARDEQVETSEPPMKEIEVEIERDFDKDPTNLYKALQEKEWEAAVSIIESQPEETKTWISRKETNGQLRWRLLPIHAAVVFAAPDSVFEALLKAYPAGAGARDDQGMLPLHLSYRMGCSESVVALLVDTYPESIDAKDRKGRTPLVLAQTSKGPNRAAFLRVIQRGTKKRELEEKLQQEERELQEKMRIEQELQAKLAFEKELETKLLELTQLKDSELDVVKQEAAEKQAALEEELASMKKALAKNQETSQVLVDHITTLETKVKKAELKANKKIAVETAPVITDEFLQKENGSLREECKTLRWDNDLLKQQLEKRAKSENLFAGQVAAMAQQIQSMTEDNGASTTVFAARIKDMEEERKSLRFSIHILSKKLYKVSEDLCAMSKEQQRMIRELKHHENQARESAEMHATVMEQLMSQDAWMETVMEERKAVQIELERQTAELKSKHVVRQSMMRTLKEHSDHLARSSLERFQFLEATTAEDQKMRDVSDVATCELPDKDLVDEDEEALVDQVVGAILTVHDEQIASFESGEGASEHASEVDSAVASMVAEAKAEVVAEKQAAEGEAPKDEEKILDEAVAEVAAVEEKVVKEEEVAQEEPIAKEQEVVKQEPVQEETGVKEEVVAKQEKVVEKKFLRSPRASPKHRYAAGERTPRAVVHAMSQGDGFETMKILSQETGFSQQESVLSGTPSDEEQPVGAKATTTTASTPATIKEKKVLTVETKEEAKPEPVVVRQGLTEAEAAAAEAALDQKKSPSFESVQKKMAMWDDDEEEKKQMEH